MDLIPPLNEGIKNTVYEIYKRIIKRGAEVLLITKYIFNDRNQIGKDIKLLEQEGLKIFFIPVKQGTANTHITGAHSFIVRLPVYLKRICKHERIEIFHIHTSFATINSFIAFQLKSFFRFKNPRVVISQYSSSFNPYVFGTFDLKSLLVPMLMNSTTLKYAPADLVITFSKKSCYIHKQYSANRVIWFPHIAIDTEKFKPDNKLRRDIRSELSIDDETIVLLYAGDLTPSRGLDLFIGVVKHLVRFYPVKGLIPLKDRNVKTLRYNHIISLLKKSEINKYFDILGYRKDINGIINSSDIVIMPLRNNYGFMDIPRFLLEAMSCNKPVITTSVGAIADVIHNWINGVICKPDDLKSLILATKTLIDNPSLRCTLGKNARKTILEIFEAEKVSDRLFKIYINLIEK